MPINFENEINEISNHLKNVEGYLACEKIIVRNIEKHLHKGCDELKIEQYLKQSSTYMEDIIASKQGGIDYINFKYASGFINELLKTPKWNNWIKLYDLKF